VSQESHTNECGLSPVRYFYPRSTLTAAVLMLTFSFPRFRAHLRPEATKKVIEGRVPELIPVLGSQPAGNVSHKPGGRLPLISARPAVTLATLKRAATNFAAW